MRFKSILSEDLIEIGDNLSGKITNNPFLIFLINPGPHNHAPKLHLNSRLAPASINFSLTDRRGVAFRPTPMIGKDSSTSEGKIANHLQCFLLRTFSAYPSSAMASLHFLSVTLRPDRSYCGYWLAMTPSMFSLVDDLYD